MKKKHKGRKQPVTALNFKSEKKQTKQQKKMLISRLHVILKELEKAKAKQDDKQAVSEKTLKIQQLQQEIEELGGLDRYQQSSLHGEQLHGNVNTSKWVLDKLKENNVRAKKGSKLKLLDVGAVRLNYTKQQKWLETDAVDLNPQAQDIKKANFFEFKVGEKGIYDIIVLSLVLNFVSSPAQRGDMLRRCRSLCADSGHLFVVLPRACLENARYLDHDLFHEMMASLNFDLVTHHDSKKLSYKMFRKFERRKETGLSKKSAFPKHEVRNGKNCNNFCIVLK
ncbi:uncharacterized protein [Diadema setosum]|uniref:uncharacterized protein n=1 Tax=Diadema setosum TaxID=31175 RepID=UPI003B3BD3A0